MQTDPLRLLLVGGPTLFFEWNGLRLLTDPTFDPAGTTYTQGPVTLTKTTAPAVPVDTLGKVDAVLLSHEQHPDNLDSAGRHYLSTVKQILTTPSSATRLGSAAQGLLPWESMILTTDTGAACRVTATPARHGPPGCEPLTGDVTGFLLQRLDGLGETIYLSGDTVWYEGVAEVAQRYRVTTTVLFLGAARVPVVGPDHLTMNAADAIQAVTAFPEATIVPVHWDGWQHFSEDQDHFQQAFAKADCTDRIDWLQPGQLAEL